MASMGQQFDLIFQYILYIFIEEERIIMGRS